MDVNIRNMTEEEYLIWIVVSTKQQALDRSSISNKSFDQEYQKLLEILKTLLPNQLNTPGHYFYSIDAFEEKNIGYIWCGLLPGLPDKSIFIMDILLKEEFRSKGLGRIALNKLHGLMKEKGYESIILNVLNKNFAKKLYSSVGYSIIEENDTNATMFKKL